MKEKLQKEFIGFDYGGMKFAVDVEKGTEGKKNGGIIDGVDNEKGSNEEGNNGSGSNYEKDSKDEEASNNEMSSNGSGSNDEAFNNFLSKFMSIFCEPTIPIQEVVVNNIRYPSLHHALVGMGCPENKEVPPADQLWLAVAIWPCHYIPFPIQKIIMDKGLPADAEPLDLLDCNSILYALSCSNSSEQDEKHSASGLQEDLDYKEKHMKRTKANLLTLGYAKHVYNNCTMQSTRRDNGLSPFLVSMPFVKHFESWPIKLKVQASISFQNACGYVGVLRAEVKSSEFTLP